MDALFRRKELGIERAEKLQIFLAGRIASEIYNASGLWKEHVTPAHLNLDPYAKREKLPEDDLNSPARVAILRGYFKGLASSSPKKEAAGDEDGVENHGSG